MKIDEVELQIDTDRDILGVKKHIHLIYKIKKSTIVLLLLAFMIPISLAIYILYLNNSLSLMQSKQIELESTLFIKKVQLKQKERAYLKKESQYLELSDRVKEIEDIIGNTNDLNQTIKQRSKILKLTTLEMKAWFLKIPNGYPIIYRGVTSSYGKRSDPMTHKKKFHRGVDLRASRKTEVFATADGFVEYGGYSRKSGYGRLVILDHNYGFKTYYGHLSKVLVKNRQFVKKGTLIALSGNSGRSSGPHLHYEIRFLQSTLNPIYFLNWNMENFYTLFKRIKKVPWVAVAESIESDINFKEQ